MKMTIGKTKKKETGRSKTPAKKNNTKSVKKTKKTVSKSPLKKKKIVKKKIKTNQKEEKDDIVVLKQKINGEHLDLPNGSNEPYNFTLGSI